MFCLKCGNELREDSVFCDKCGAKIGKISSSKSNNDVTKKLIIGIGVALLILVALLLVFSGEPTTNQAVDVANSLEDEYIDEENTYENELKNSYFNWRVSNGGHVFGAIYADAEFLLRGSKVFEDIETVAEGTVNSLLPSENSNEFLITVNHADYYNDKAVTRIALTGKYPDDGTRFVAGDHVWFIGEYGGVSMFERTDGSHAEYAIIKNCKPVKTHNYSFSEIKTIINSIFSEDFDIHTESNEVEEFYTFSRTVQAGTVNEKWLFNVFGGEPSVSFDGGESYYQAEFDDSFSHYILKKTAFVEDGKDKIKYISINGDELWQKEFNYGSRFVLHNDKLYVYDQGEVLIFDKDSGEIISEPVFVAEIDTIKVVDNKLIFENDNSIISLGSDGRILWRYVSQNGFAKEYNYSNTGKYYVFAEGKTEKNYKGENQYIKAYRRIDLETGEIIAEIELTGN
ncbi:MAG: zinc-ribbon domain-containing protein [bacterium]|nr:zinc-ribbon domain-containing protein [bacterium]